MLPNFTNWRTTLMGSSVLILVLGIGAAEDPIKSANLNVDAKRILAADSEPHNWLGHGRTYDEQRYSPLDQITDKNVADIGLAWAIPTGYQRGHEATPLVVDGVMYLTLPWSNILALDAKTGQELWAYDPMVKREVARNACCDVVNRGAALWKGRLYSATLDGRLLSLDAKSGELIWQVQTTDLEKPYTITGAPRIVKDKVIIGNGGAEYGVRGYITAYDTETGQELWRFYTVPGDPSEPFEHPELEAAAKTWTGEWWKQGGGGTAWDSMAFDAELDTLYVGTGNGSPWNRAIRSPEGGDNLYLSSILALEPDTGKLKWHYQTTPADNWDYTATQHMILADLEIDGAERRVLMQAPKNGFFYVLDRESGELISAEKYIDATWASHVDMETGRPIETGTGDYKNAPQLVVPSSVGGHNWQPMAFNPNTGLVYIPTRHEPFLFINERDYEPTEGAWNTGVDFASAVSMVFKTGQFPEVKAHIKAWDPVTQKVAWSVEHATNANAGLLTTAGNLVFQGRGDGSFAAWKADSGDKLWEVDTKVGMIAPPITYAIDGEQYVAVVAGWGGVPAIVGTDLQTAASISHVNQGHVFAFALKGSEDMPKVVARRTQLIPEPPEATDDPKVIALGEHLYNTHCFQCHGVGAMSGRVISDLRYSSSAVHKNFNKIVLDGALKDKGMDSFADLLDAKQVEAIHEYVKARAAQDRAMMLQAAEAAKKD